MLSSYAVSKSIQVPKQYHGKVIGKQQATKLDIESDYGVQITMPSRTATENAETVVIEGPTQTAVTAAENRIMDICGIKSATADAGRAKLDQLDKDMDQAFAYAKSLPNSNAAARTAAYAKANALKDEYDKLRSATAHKVFAEKNMGYGDDQMDLHGLSVKDAEMFVNQRLDKVQSKWKSSDPFVLSIITGFGHHSDNNVAKIKPAIMQLLQQRGFRYRLDESEGTLLVDGLLNSGKPSSASPAPAAPRTSSSGRPVQQPKQESTEAAPSTLALLVQLFTCCLVGLFKNKK